jgi:PrcB C-terminal
VLTACGSSQAIAYEDISHRLHEPQFPRPVRSIFRTRASLADYLEHAMPGRAPAVPPIDFGRREAILIASGPRSSTGYALRVISVRDTGSRVAVTVEERAPRLGDAVAARVTYPFLLLTIPRSGKGLFLHYEGRP